jgi:hypothetical protein
MEPGAIVECLPKLWGCGAREIHIRPACPPLMFPCRFALSTRSIEELAGKEIVKPPARRKLKVSDVVIFVLAIAVIILAWPKIYKPDLIKRLRSSGEKISVAV